MANFIIYSLIYKLFTYVLLLNFKNKIKSTIIIIKTTNHMEMWTVTRNFDHDLHVQFDYSHGGQN